MACYRVFKVFLTVCFSVFLLAGTLFARSGDPMYDFYDGLNKVMERNENNPSKCAAEAKSFIQANIGPLKQASQRGRQMAASGQYDNMDQAGVEQAMSNMMQSKGFQAMQECMDTIQNFAEEHPEAAEEIFEAMGSGQEGGF